MNEDSRLNFGNLHSVHGLDKKSTSNNQRHYRDESSNYYLKYLNDNKKGSGELENSPPYQSFVKEIEKLNNQIEELRKEKNGLKQQCKAAIQQWDKTLSENREAKEQLIRFQQQRDDALKKMNHEISLRVKVAKDLARLTEERNSAVHEYNLIMSERDSVHKEMEKQNEELAQYQKKLKSLDADKKSLLNDVENLKKEITNNKIKSMDKQFLIQQVFKEKYNDSMNSFSQYGLKSVQSTNKWGSSSSGFSSGWTQFGKNPLSSFNSNINSLQTFNQIDPAVQKQFPNSNSSSLSTMGNNKSKAEFSENELELRKRIQALEQNYNYVIHELKDCISKNEKVVKERESIKTLCDNLRRERDRAIRDRAEAIQDMNDFRLKIESNAQIKKYMDEDQTKSKQTNASSKDSAISADIHEAAPTSSDYENMNILLTNNFRHNNGKFKNPWGFSVRSQDKRVLVSGINVDSSAEDKLKLNDIILSINSINITDEQLANELLCKYDKELQLVIQRKRQLSSVLNINLDCCKNEHGIVLENAFLIKKLLPDSVAARNENVSVGDRLLSINGKTLENSTIHDVMQLLREDKLLLKVYKQSLKNQNTSYASLLLNQNIYDNNQNSILIETNAETKNQTNSNKFLNTLNKPSITYHKDDLHLTMSNKLQSNYSPKIAHYPYQSIKRSSKKSKVLLNDSSSSFGTEYEKGSPTLFNKTLNRIFKKSYKSKNEKKEENTKKGTPENEILDNFNKIINNLSERDSEKKLFAGKPPPAFTSSEKERTNNSKNAGGTWPSCKSNVNPLSSPTYGKVNPSTTYSKKKERKSLTIFENYMKNGSARQNKENYIDNVFHKHSKDERQDKMNSDYNSFNDYQPYGVIEKQSIKTLAGTNENTPVHESNPYRSLLHNATHGKHSLSSSISSYSSKDNYKSNNGKKYTLNHDLAFKPFNAPSSSSSIQMDQEYQIKKSKEKKYLDAYSKQNKSMFDPQSAITSYQQPSFGDLHEEKSSRDTLYQMSRSSFGFYSITNKRQFIANNNMTPNYSQDLDSYLNSSVDQGLTGSNGTVEHSAEVVDNTSSNRNNNPNPYFLQSNLDSMMKKSSPININEFKALNRLSTTSSPPYHLNENLLLNSPSHYATFTANSTAQQQSNKDENYYLNKPSTYERSGGLMENHPPSSSNIYGYINQTSPLHHQTNNPLESISSLSSNIYSQEDFLINSNKNQRLYISSNNSVASKLSNCSMDSNSIHSNAINSSSNYFKKAANNESLDSVSYSNIQSLRNQAELLNKTKNHLSLDKKMLTNKVKKSKNSSIDRSTNTTNTNRENYSEADKNPKCGEIRQIFIEKPKEKSLGIQIECGRLSSHGDSKQVNSPGVFVSYVNEGSLAKKSGVKVGDQLLEICGINMRSANKDAAANVLRQCGQTGILMKLQYNPDKFFVKDDENVKDESNKEEDKKSETNLDQQIDEDEDTKKKELNDMLQNFNRNIRQDLVSSETIDKEDDSCSEKCLYF